MNKKTLAGVVILCFAVIIAVGLFKPYLSREKINTSDGDLIIQTNIITNSMRFFDSRTMKWYEKQEYISLKIKRINDQFDKLIINNYQTLVNILNGKEIVDYEFIPADKLVELNTKLILNDMTNNAGEILRNRAAMMEEFNKLVNNERNKRINEIQDFINKGDFSGEGLRLL